MNDTAPTYNEKGYRVPHTSGHAEVFAPVRVPEAQFFADWQRGRTDIEFWALRFLGVRLHKGQRTFAKASNLLSEDNWHVLFRSIVVSAGNRAGKTLVLALVVLHHAFYKTGLRPPIAGDKDSLEHWVRAPYAWYHVSYRQTIARHVYREICLIAAGDHPAQRDKATGVSRGCPLTTMFPSIIVTDKVYEGLYEWIQIHPGFGGANIHFRNTDEKAKGLLGLDANGVSMDEAAFEMYLDEVNSNVLDARRGTTGGPLYFISTPDFHDLQFPDLWATGDPANPNRQAKTFSMRMSTRDNVDFGLTSGEFDDMIAHKPQWWIDQHIDGHFVQSEDAFFNAAAVEATFVDDLPEEQEPVNGHRYVQGVDVGIARDPTCAIVLDYSDKRAIFGARANRSFGSQTTPAIINLAREGHLLFSQGTCSCASIVDATSMGGEMFLQALRDAIYPVWPFDFAGAPGKKTKLLSDLRSLIDSGALKLPRKGRFWQEIRRQLLAYKIEDRKIAQDWVMTLAIAVYHARLNWGTPSKDNYFTYFGGGDGSSESE